jgi:hypothetical protein
VLRERAAALLLARRHLLGPHLPGIDLMNSVSAKNLFGQKFPLKQIYFYIFLKKLPPHTLAGFDLTTHSFNLIGLAGWQAEAIPLRPSRRGAEI